MFTFPFAGMFDGRPYPATGINTGIWNGLPVEYVSFERIFLTQAGATTTSLFQPENDDPVFIVEWQGCLYLEDGHHRAIRKAIQGYMGVDARVFREAARVYYGRGT